MAFDCVEVPAGRGKNARACSVRGCDRPYRAKGLCGTHWLRAKKYGDPLKGAAKQLPLTCEVDGCSSPTSARLNGLALCNRHWQRMYKRGAVDHPKIDAGPWRTCRSEGCTAKARSAFGDYCEKHYARIRRKGHDADPKYARRWLSSDGYVLMPKPAGHPAGGSTGVAYEHRIVLYDAIGPGAHNCHWCKRVVRWEVKRGPEKLVVDHVDSDKQNNDLANLVPSCSPCNYTRGLFMSWVMKHRDDPFLHRLFDEARKRGVRHGPGAA